MAWGFSANLNSSAAKNLSALAMALNVSQECLAGTVLVLVCASDNLTTSTGVTTDVTSVYDSGGSNTWIKGIEYSRGGTVAGGATVSIWYSLITTTLASSANVSAEWSSAPAARAMTLNKYTIAAGSTISVEGTPQGATGALDPPSMTISGLTSGEYLFIRGIAGETNDVDQITVTSGYDVFSGSQTSGGGAASNMAVRGEYIIYTGTSQTSNPTWVSADNADGFFALLETLATGNPLPPLLPRFNGMNTLIRM
jgi:hypothetical protein